MADGDKRALELIAQAEKKAKTSGGIFTSIFGTGNAARQEEISELYIKAANIYKMSKKWPDAGTTYAKAAQVQVKLDAKHEAATQYINASNCFKKNDPREAVNCLQLAINIYTDMGRFTIAAKNHISIAELYESDLADLDHVNIDPTIALSHYETAADFYKGEESNSSANKCLLKVAQYSAQMEQYSKAIEIYEQVAMNAIDSQLLRYSAKEYFFRAAICHLINDTQDAMIAVEKYEKMFPNFTDSRECKLMKVLMKACEEQEVEVFTEAIRDYDSISRLDPWFTAMFLKIKKVIDGEPDLR